MTAAIPPPRRPYGAIELKQHYQRGLTWALLIAAAAHLAAIGGARWYGALHQVTQPPVIDVVPSQRTVIEPGDPIRVIPDRPVGIDPPAAPPDRGVKGIPRPEPDVTVTTENVLLTRGARRDLLKYGGRTEGDTTLGEGRIGLGGVDDVDVVLPERTTFVPYQKEPRRLKSEAPEYPEFARGTGVEAVVRIHLWINVDGTVRAPKIVYCSTPNLGFEEAALDAVQSWIFAPAEQNGEPVGIWYIVPISFQIQ